MAGKDVYVLTTQVDNSEWRPIAVVTDENVADQWQREGKNNDWIPMQLDDLSLSGLARDSMTPFQPKPTAPADTALRDTLAQQKMVIGELQELVKDLTKKLRKLQKQGSEEYNNPLLSITE